MRQDAKGAKTAKRTFSLGGLGALGVLARSSLRLCGGAFLSVTGANKKPAK
jgi:hypothetical protein